MVEYIRPWLHGPCYEFYEWYARHSSGKSYTPDAGGPDRAARTIIFNDEIALLKFKQYFDL